MRMQAGGSATILGCDKSRSIEMSVVYCRDLVGTPSTGKLTLLHWSKGCKMQHCQNVCASAPSEK